MNLIRRPFFIMPGLALFSWCTWYYSVGDRSFIIIQENWEIAITMAFGSFLAGATSEGGGAVAFPVFTKLLSISAHDAKVFSLAIQSVGMSTASLFIIAMRIPVEWRVVLWASLGGVPGIIVGSTILSPLLSEAMIKMTFTLMVTSFAVTLYLLNRKIRSCYEALPQYRQKEKSFLLIAGFVGGIMSGLVGNGIDIVVFSTIVLLFRISEKVATPTSVVLMAINALFGFLLHYLVLKDFLPHIQDYWLSAIPIVVVGAPFGALVCTYLNRETIAWILIGLIALEFLTSLLIIPLNKGIIVASIISIIFFSSLYSMMYRSKLYIKW